MTEEPPGHEDAEEAPPARRRRRRRASRAGTNPVADDGPETTEPRAEPDGPESPHDRWLREQRPPHWE